MLNDPCKRRLELNGDVTPYLEGARDGVGGAVKGLPAVSGRTGQLGVGSEQSCDWETEDDVDLESGNKDCVAKKSVDLLHAQTWNQTL